VKDACYAKW
jgi:hypothetical protein